MNHSLASRVAARSPQHSPPPPRDAATLRRELRAVGAELEQLCREGIGAMVDALPASPAPRMLYADLRRHRPASLTQIGAALAGLSQYPDAAPRLDAFADSLAAWVRGLSPVDATDLLACWRRETQEQARADVAMAEALTVPSLPALDRAIDATAAHAVQAQAVLVTLRRARRRHDAERRAARQLAPTARPRSVAHAP